MHTALSALHLEQGFAPSHFDFFSRHLSQALHTLFLALSCCSSEKWEPCGDELEFMLHEAERP